MIVVTSINLGWDCIVAVYPQYVNPEYVKLGYPESMGYVVHKVTPSTVQDLEIAIEERGLNISDLIIQETRNEPLNGVL